LEAARQLEPGSVEALVALGDLYQGQGKVAEAKEAYRQATSLAPGVAAPYLRLAELALQQGDENEAWWQYEAARTAEPASADPLVGLAAARAGQGDWEEAETAYRQAMALAPASTAAHLGLADALQAQAGNLDSALETFQQISGPGIDRSAVYLAMGELCLNTPTALGCSRELTEGFFHQAAQLEPASPQGYLGLVDLYLQEGRPNKAEGFAMLALEIAPHDPTVRISLGSIYQVLGDHEVAESHFREAIDLDATRPDGYNALAGLYLAQEEYPEAVAAYEKTMGLAPLDGSLWLSVGNVYAEQEKYDEALSAYERAAEMSPAAAEPWLSQGDVYAAQEKWKAARKRYEQAQMLRPNQADALLRLANIYEEQEKLSQAESYARQAVEVDPIPATGWVTLGRILSTNEEFDEAAEAYLSALQRDPRRRAAYDRWMRCYTDIKRQPYSVDRSRLETELGKLAKSDEAGTVWAQALLGLSWLSLEKNTDEAIAYLEEAVRLDPSFVELYLELAPTYEKALDGRRALEAWQRYVYASPPGTDTDDAEKKIDSLLQVHIEQPAADDAIAGSVEIRGTAMAEGFQSYKLRYKAESSDAWFEIFTAKSEVEEGLLATWDTAGLAPAEYRLRLDVTAKDDVPYDEIGIEVKPTDWEGG
jgi:tetratricopeptide (TPR) repeat protein